ncbi:MAG: hypothetical protein WAN47_09960 [Nitrosotalea sp.]
MKTLHLAIILASTFLLLTLGTHNTFASQEFILSSLPINLSPNPPVMIDQVELDSAFALFPDNQTCYDKPGFANNYTCSTNLVPGHKVQCAYFIGSSYCEPIHRYTSGTRQTCLDLNTIQNTPQWFDMYNTQNKTVQIQLFALTIHQGTRPWGQQGIPPAVISLGPYEKCTYTFNPVDEPLSLDQTNMSTVISYTYGAKNYTVSTPELTDIQNDSRTWQLDGNKWVFAEQNTVQPPEIPILPLQQLKSGIPIEYIQCKPPLVLFLKQEDKSPACLTLDTSDKLQKIKWLAQPPYRNIIVNKTRDLVTSSPTFETFGIKSTLFVDNDFTCILTEPLQCTSQAFFDGARPGYGNGTNPLVPVNTIIHHNVTILTNNTNHVECAVIDGLWDDLNQKPLEKNDPICGYLYGFKGGLP